MPKEQTLKEGRERELIELLKSSPFYGVGITEPEDIVNLFHSQIKEARKEAIKEFWEAIKLDKKEDEKEMATPEEIELLKVLMPAGQVINLLNNQRNGYNQAISDITKKAEELLK